MGLDGHAIVFLLDARDRGVSFESVATLGRQALHIDEPTLSMVLTNRGIPTTRREAGLILNEDHGFCEPLFRLLGAATVRSIDFSAYQHATDIHDMNTALPAALQDAFTLLVDGGTLEHVFNFPQAIANCMQALRCGGVFVGTSPANNFMGHGFYQFSPELFFRVFSREYGFRVDRLIVYEDVWPGDWYEVQDPEVARRRVTLVNRHPTQLLVLARKTSSVPTFPPFPQQSDYVSWWKEAETDLSTPSIRTYGNSRRWPGGSLLTSARAALGRLVPAAVKDRYHQVRAGGDRFDPQVFKKVDRQE